MNLNATLIIEVVSFIVLLGFLTKFLYRPMLQFLDARTGDIKKIWDDAERDRDDAKKKLDMSLEDIRIAKEEALKLKYEARVKTEESIREMLADAKVETDKMMEKSNQAIQRELEQAKLEIRKEAVYLSISLAEKILHREITSIDHEELMRETLEEI